MCVIYYIKIKYHYIQPDNCIELLDINGRYIDYGYYQDFIEA